MLGPAPSKRSRGERDERDGAGEAADEARKRDSAREPATSNRAAAREVEEEQRYGGDVVGERVVKRVNAPCL